MRLTLLLALALAACTHTRKVGPESPKEEASKKEEKAEKPQEGKDKGATATMPRAMFEPSATKKIQRKLADRGYNVKVTGTLDDQTRNALIKLQSEKGLPRTGMPDKETLRRLGLEPDEVFKQTSKTK
jgi:peptidoglycan hydrolase-like protein with peptidoglycan-binding domain